MKLQHLPKRPTGIRLLILAQYPRNIFLSRVLKKEEKDNRKGINTDARYRTIQIRIIKVEVSVKADNTYRDLDYSRYHKNQI